MARTEDGATWRPHGNAHFDPPVPIRVVGALHRVALATPRRVRLWERAKGDHGPVGVIAGRLAA